MAIIELSNIFKSYEKHMVIDNFSYSFEKGSITAIVGESGKGKSTLLNMIGLLEKPNRGNLVINNIKNPKVNSKAAILLQRNIIGYLFQNYALVDNMTVNQNLDIALKYQKIKDKVHAKQQALSRVGLTNRLNSKIYELSGGEQQRVALARLMLKPCEIVLADEPTGSLDAHNRKNVMDLLEAFSKEGKTVIIATHDDFIASNCEQVLTL